MKSQDVTSGARIEGGRKPRKQIQKLSAKRAKAHPESRFSTIAKPTSSRPSSPRTSGIKKKKRTPEQFDRVYGPEDYQIFTRAQPCACCGCYGATQICHAKTGGKGRKDDWQRTFPGCGPHVEFTQGEFGCTIIAREGCNNTPERIGKRTFEAKIGKTLVQLAAEHQAKYRAHVESMGER